MNRFGSDITGQTSFPGDRYNALEGGRKLLGLTTCDLNCLLRVLCKSSFGHLGFSLGDVSISLTAAKDEGICLTFELERKGFERSAAYNFRPSDFGVSITQKRLEEFGGE